MEHWNGGCHDTKGLFEQIQQLGYAGSYDTVARYTRRLRCSQGIPLRERLVKKPLPLVSEPSKRLLTPRRARTLVLKRSESRETEEEGLLERLKASHPELDEAIELAQDFASLVRQRQPQQFDFWLERARNSSLSLFRRFAAGLSSDYKAVKAGISLETSNGPVEGHINRLKMRFSADVWTGWTRFVNPTIPTKNIEVGQIMKGCSFLSHLFSPKADKTHNVVSKQR